MLNDSCQDHTSVSKSAVANAAGSQTPSTTRLRRGRWFNNQSVGNLRWKRDGATLRGVVYAEPGAVPPYA